jgi:hypothetical protein
VNIYGTQIRGFFNGRKAHRGGANMAKNTEIPDLSFAQAMSKVQNAAYNHQI